MTEETEKKNDHKPKEKMTADKMRKSVQGQIKEAQIKNVQAKVKTKLEELDKAKKVVRGIEAEIEEIFDENEEVFE